MNSRFKNPYFWLGLIGVLLTAAGINPEKMTSWHVLYVSIVDSLKNPYVVYSVIPALLGVFINPTTPGLSDNECSIKSKNK